MAAPVTIELNKDEFDFLQHSATQKVAELGPVIEMTVACSKTCFSSPPGSYLSRQEKACFQACPSRIMKGYTTASITMSNYYNKQSEKFRTNLINKYPNLLEPAPSTLSPTDK